MEVLMWLALGVSLLSLGVSAAALAQSRGRRTPLPEPPAALPEPIPSPLEGLTVVLAIRQDHAHPVFADLLTETLRRVNAEVVPSEGDLTISGTVTCNGYSDLYYRAEVTCTTPSETLCTVIENPASGDRQANLATELVRRIEEEIKKRVSRNERRLALKELKGL